MKLSTFTPSLLLALATSAAAVHKGFNYGANAEDGSCNTYWDFYHHFKRAKNLVGASGFTSARLYTSIQCDSTDSPIEGIKAALDTDTSLLLGVWASSGQASIDDEITAIKQAITDWPDRMKEHVVAISVGSEDIYRSLNAGNGVGANASTISSYITQVRDALEGTVLEDVKIGHVDTRGAWVSSDTKQVIDKVDFLGVDEFPYYEDTHANAIGDAVKNFKTAITKTEDVAQGKPVWVTETGWPYTGPLDGDAVASPANAKTYYDDVGCALLFGQRNTWWYTLFDANSAQTEVLFAVVDATGQRYNLKCPTTS